MRWLLVVCAGLVFGCSQPRTAADQCRAGNAFRRAGRGMGGTTNSTADALEDMRCDALAAEERAEARERERVAREERRQREAAAARIAVEKASAPVRPAEAQQRARAAPRPPELGATSREVRITCERQGGALALADGSAVCTLGGEALFLADLREDRARRVVVELEGAELADVRQSFEAQMGPAEERVANGFRVFFWREKGVEVRMIDRGVRVTRTAD